MELVEQLVAGVARELLLVQRLHQHLPGSGPGAR